MAMKPVAPKGRPVDTSKLAAKPTRSLPTGTTVAKPKAVSKAMGKSKC